MSTRKFLLALVGAVLVPLLAFEAFLLAGYATSERGRFEREAAQIARHVALVIDGELAGLISLLKGIATSSALAADDFAAFYVEAKRLVERGDEVIVLRDLGLRQILNTQRPFGSELPPPIAVTPADRETFAAGRPLVSEVYQSPISGEARIAVALPIMRDGAPRYVLALTVPTTRIRDALLPAVPPGWIIGIGDKDATYVTRSARHDDVTGKPGVPDYVAKAAGRSGTFTSLSLEGVELLAGYHWSEFSGWLYAANIPREVVEKPLWQSIRGLGLLGAAALTLSALLAYSFGASFAAAARGLAQRAADLGQGRLVLPLPSRLREFTLVGDALAAAAAAVEQRTRELETVLSTVPAAVVFTYDPAVRRVIRNKFAAELFRAPQGESSALASPEFGLQHVRLLKDGRVLPREDMPLRRAMRGEHVDEEEYTCAFDDGTSRTLLTSATALCDDKGVIVGAVSVSVDISERKRSEEQRQLLVNELNHRVKNTLATVQSIAHQTLRGAGSMAAAQSALTDRLITLAKAHDLLTTENWEGAELEAIVRGATEPHGGPARFTISGPPVRLSPSASLTFAVALHELATNAAKYGALSAEGGSVAVSWEVANHAAGPKVTLRWAERGGPPVQAPARKGFGSRLLERSFSAELDGSASVDYAPGGVVWIMEAPIRPRASTGRARETTARTGVNCESGDNFARER